MGASLIVSGASDAISDITPAGGWDILNCSSDSTSQLIRIVCTGDDASCDHLHQNGAEDTLVRLPESCGKGPFARVSEMVMSDNQTVPSEIASKLAGREGSPRKVMTVGLDTNFSASAHGPISFKLVGSSIPNVMDNIEMSPSSRRRKVDRRGNTDDVKNTLQAFSDFFIGNFDKNISTSLPPINIDQDFLVLSQNISCSQNVNAGLEIDFDTKADTQVTLGVVAQGSIIPPTVTEFALFAALTADLDGTLNIDANVVGSIDTGEIPLFTTGLPGLDIAGIFSIGPTFSLNAEAKAAIDVDIDFKVDLTYEVSNLQLVFPPSQGDSSAELAPKDSPLQLSVSPNIATNGTMEAHLIPSLTFGISLAGIADASIFLDLDAFATLDLDLDAAADATIDTNGDKSASADVEGCVDLKGGFSVNAGAQGSFFDIFNEDTEVPIISKEFELFQKCFAESTSASSSVSAKGGMVTTSTSAAKTSAYATSASAPSAPAPSFLTSKEVSSGSLSVSSIQSKTPIQSISSASANAPTSSSVSVLSPSSSAEQPAATGSYQRRKSRGLKDRAALACTPSDVGLAQSLVDELLSSASFKSI